MSLSENIRARRYEIGMSQLELATAVGVTQAHLSLIERGSREPAFSTGCRIAAALGWDPNEMSKFCDQTEGKHDRKKK